MTYISKLLPRVGRRIARGLPGIVRHPRINPVRADGAPAKVITEYPRLLAAEFDPNRDIDPQRRLRLLSYNIQTGIATAKYHHYLTHSWKHVLPHRERVENLRSIARILNGYDVVGLQEVDSGSLRSGFINQTEFLAERAEFPFWHDQTNRDLGKFAQHSIGVLSRFRPERMVEHKLPGMIPGRGVMSVHFRAGQNELVLLILHLSLGRRARLRQLGFVSELISEQPHVVVMGDLNCRSDSHEMRWLLRHSHLGEPVPGLCTFPSWRPLHNIDHILVSESLEVVGVRALNYAFSDHLPIAMEVLLPFSLDDAQGPAVDDPPPLAVNL